jgi:general secretion pathway protein G
MKKFLTGKKGFTLIELLVVLAVIATLSAVVMTMLREARARARDARRMSDMNEIFKALSLYQNEKRTYPVYTGNITSSDPMSEALESTGVISNVPTDPLAGYTYTYTSTNGSTFAIGFCLETDTIKGYVQGCDNLISP